VIRVVVVTDRKLLGSAKLADRVAAMLSAAPRGSVMIQVREKDLDGGPLLKMVREVIEVARPAGAQVWVNDRVDVALAAGADGVHLGEQALSIADARATVGAMPIGCSRHVARGVLAAVDEGAALVQLGPVWAVPGKGEPIGLEALSVRIKVPLVAVGGIDGPARARHAALAGADAVAVIRAAWSGSADVVGKLVEAVDAGITARKSSLRP
jgi:thiamine-phosphate pyrophosphorylase